jgi:hypothetical protein
MEITATASGPNQEQLAEILRVSLAQTFGQDARREDRAPGGEPVRDAGTTIALIALILSLPGAINELVTLGERAKFKQRLGSLLERARGTAGAEDTVTLQIGDGPPIDLKGADAAKVLDALERTLKR